jgi:membrane protease YdiL (CAAX protease family)
LFGVYHWQAGIGNVVSATVFGIAAMLFYVRAGSIVPLIIAHFAINLLLTLSP